MKPEYSHLSYETGAILEAADEEKQRRMNTELREWLNTQLARAEQSLKAREQSEVEWRSGTDKEWAEAAEIHPSTRGKPMSKAARLQAADIESRISVKCRKDVRMWKTVIGMLEEKDGSPV